MGEWNTFFGTMAGASATLTGLIFVGISINLGKVLSIRSMPDRGLESLILLLSILIISAMMLIPRQSTDAVGVEVVCNGAIVWSITLFLDVRIWRNTSKEYRPHSAQNIIFSQLAVLPYILSGIMILLNGPAGIYWLVPGIAASFIKAIIDAWVMLVEINR